MLVIKPVKVFNCLVRGLVALSAINRFGTVGLERNLGLNTTGSTHSRIHLALAAETAAATAAISTATATALFRSATARLTFSGSLESFGLIELLFFNGKRKLGTANSTLDLLFD
jgi:hypothetical protein